MLILELFFYLLSNCDNCLSQKYSTYTCLTINSPIPLSISDENKSESSWLENKIRT